MSNGHIRMSTNQKPNIILFDGVCNLCSGFVQFVLKKRKAKEYSIRLITVKRSSDHSQGKWFKK